LKKIIFILLIAVSLILGSVGSAFAAAGWQTIGYDTIKPNQTQGYVNPIYDELGGVHVLQDGGNVGIRVPDHINYASWSASVGTPTLYIEVYEDDGAAGDDYVKIIRHDIRDGAKTYTVPMGDRADGGNNKAEVQVRYTYNYYSSGYVNIQILD
jgi:hypothetical protein